MDVDAALSEVPVNIMPLLDDTDFKTRETGITYNASGMDLVWNFVTSAGAYTQTAVTPTTSGTYDWTHQGDGMYSIEIPASGGASINNDTEGYGWFTGVATGVLPWRGPIIGFRHSAINDSLCDTNSTGLLAPTTAGRTLDVSAGGEAGVDWANVGSPTTSLALTGTTIAVTQKVDVDTIKTNPVVNAGTITFPTGATLASTTNITAGTITTTTNLTNLPAITAGWLTATGIAADAITAAKLAADVTTELQSGLATAAALATLQTTADDILTDTGTTLPSMLSTIAGYIDTEIAAIITAVDALPTNAELATALGTADDAVLAQVALVKAKTDSLTFTVAGQVDANVQYVNDIQVTGNGETGTEWGPV